MAIVIDVGCATYGGDESVNYLLEEFSPQILYGFDPGLDRDFKDVVEGCVVDLRRQAAWTHDGTVGFRVAGLGGHVEESGRVLFRCVDLARFILDLDSNDVVLKMDAEGAEYTLLPWLVEQNADLRLRLALIEWHCEECGIGGNGRHREGCPADKEAWIARRASVEGALRCETGEWNR